MGDDTTRPRSESDVYALFAERRRRLVLRILQDFPTPMAVDELATLVANCEYEDPASDLVDVVTVSLYHAHLPKLAAADAIAYDRDAGTVSPGPEFGVLVGTLTELSEDGDLV